MGTFYRSRHELIFAIIRTAPAHKQFSELGQHGRYRTRNVWQYKACEHYEGWGGCTRNWHFIPQQTVQDDECH